MSPTEPPDSDAHVQQHTHGDRNQTVGQVYGGLVVYVSGGQAIFHPEQGESPSQEKATNPVAEIGPNPYKGLLSFQEGDSENFFGRSQDIDQLWGQFRDLQNADMRLLPMYGPSGSGKSSLVRAGLIPALGQRLLPGREKARVAVLVPGTQPLQALATVLARIADNDLTPVKKTREFSEELGLVNKAGQYDGLQRIANALPEIGTVPLIVLVDQFEEVYSLCEATQERDAMIATLLYAASDRSRYVSVILTMRSDFLGETQKHPMLNRLFSSQGFLVPTMGEDNLREAIAQPAEKAGQSLDPATVKLLLEQTQGREGALPLLQFALTRIWEGLKQGEHPAVTLERIGGVGGALAGEAQRIYESLSEAEQSISRRVFVGLVQLGEGAKDTRRRALIGDFVSQKNSLEQVKQVIDRFADSGTRLITLASNGTSETAEVTHEALFDHWQDLKLWLDSGRSDIRFQRRLEEAAKYWDGNGRPEGSLWRPPDLDLLRRYRQRVDKDMIPLQAEFFRASERSEKTRKRLQQAGLGGLVAGLLFTVYQLQQAQRQRVEQLAITAEALLATQPIEAEINAIAAVGLGQSAFVRFPNYPMPSAHNSLLKVIQANREQYRLNHESAVRSVAFSPDGKRIVSGSVDKTVRLWDASTGQALGQPLKGHKAGVNSVAFSPDGKRIVSGSVDKTVRLWDASTGQALGQPLKGHKAGVNSVAFSSDGKRLVSGSGDKTVRLWDATTGQPLGPPLKGHKAGVNSVAFSSDGKRLVSGSGDKTVRLWDATTGQSLGPPLKGHEDGVNSVAFSPDGKRLVSGSGDKTVRLWDATTGQSLGPPLKGHESAVYSVAFSPDGKRLVSGSWDKTVRLWDATTGQSLGPPLKGHEDGVNSVAFSLDSKRLVSGSLDQTVRLWDATTGQPLGSPLKGHESAVWSVAFSPDGKRLVSGSWDKTVRLWDATTGQPLGSPLKGHESAVWSVAFSPDGKRLVSGSGDKTVRLWDATTGQPLGTPLKGHESAVWSVAFSPDGKRLVSGSGRGDRTVRLWDATTGQPLGSPLKGHESAVYSVAFSLDGKRLVSGSGDKTVRLWDATTGQPLGSPLKGHESAVYSVAFSLDGKRLVSGSLDRTVRLWDATTGQSLGLPLKGHESAVNSVAFSPDGKRLVSGSLDRTVRLWDATTGQPLGSPLKGHESAVNSVAFSLDGKRLVSGSLDHTVRLWSLPLVTSLESLLQATCEQLQYHSALVEPKTDIARDAKQTCAQNVWKK